MNDKLDKNGVWQGTQGEYFEFAKEIFDDCMDRDPFLKIDPMLEDILKEIPQDKIESIISKHSSNLEQLLIECDEEEPNRLGLLIKSKGENNDNNG